MQQMLFAKKTAMAVAIGLALTVGLAGCGGSDDVTGTVAVTATEMRAVTNLNAPTAASWKFMFDATNGMDASAAESALANCGEAITLPHTWNATDAASTSNTVPYKRGKGWYRLEFDNTGNGATKWLQFDGASMVADVYLNGEKLGQHKGAFTAFRFDVTGKLKAGKNVLLVKVDNTKPTTNNDLTAIAPLSGDFNVAGGLYRGVSLVATPNAAHFALDDLGSSGIFAKTTAVSGGTATVNINAKLKNDTKVDGNFIIQASLLEADGKTVKKAIQKTVSIKAGASAELAQDMSVESAHLWNGLSDPYLYKLVVELKDSAGAPLDKVVQDFGIRTMSFDANTGFYLNGKSYPLHGVNMHQDALGKAWAITPADTDEKLDVIKEIGANTLRLAHYPHDQYTLQQADKRGLVVWAEHPFVDKNVLDCKTTTGPTVEFKANQNLQLKELVRQQFNHASIGMWSIANEVGWEKTCNGVDYITPMLKELHTLSKQEDPSRVTTLADVADPAGFTAWPALPTSGVTDIWAINRYYLWYNDYYSIAPFEAELEAKHKAYPNQPMGVSEYGAGAAISHQTDNALGGKPGNWYMGQMPVMYQPEGYAAWVHEQNYSLMASKPYIWGTYVWNMFDFGSGIRNEGDIRGVNTKGLVTFDHKTKKDPFYFYKANWSKEPVTHITGKRYTDRAYQYADVKVYSNADSVTLKVNGNAVATKTAAQCAWKTCVFPNVKLSAGTNSIVAEGSHAGKAAVDTASWNLSADNANNVYIAAGQVTTGFKSTTGHRYGSDNFFTGGLGVPLINQGDEYVDDWAPVNVFGSTSDANQMQYIFVRSGASFSYDIPLADGTYSVTLGFAEPNKGTVIGGRVFSVAANGQTAISNLDVLAAAGAYRTAITRTFPVTVSGGKLKLDFAASKGEAMVSNLTIVKQ